MKIYIKKTSFPMWLPWIFIAFTNLVIDVLFWVVGALITIFACIHNDTILKNLRSLGKLINWGFRSKSVGKYAMTLLLLHYVSLIFWLYFAIKLGSIFMVLLMFISFTSLPILLLTTYLLLYGLHSIFSKLMAEEMLGWEYEYPEWFLAVIDYFYIGISFTISQ
jgi:hypothetical protein